MPEPTLIDPERQFIVALDNGLKVAWGPFGSREEAEQFAAFIADEVDPAEVRTLSSPTGELLAWREASQEWGRLDAAAEPESGRP